MRQEQPLTTVAKRHAATRIESYDSAAWTGLMPELSHAVSRPAMQTVYQTAAMQQKPGEVSVPAGSSFVLVFWARGQQVECRLDQRRADLKPKPWDFTLIPPGVESWWRTTPDVARDVFHMHLPMGELSAAVEREEARGAASIPLLPVCADPVVRENARWLFHALGDPEPPGDLLWVAIHLSTALRLIRLSETRADSGRTPKLAPWQLKRVTERMCDRIAEPVRLEELAALAKLSPFHFARAFKQSTGLPPHRYQLLRRMERAKELLAASEQPLAEVAAACGYASQKAFARMFQRETGFTPTAWRNGGR
ncbi:MAG: AraC family transcriptional regulator [Hyphomicrobiales bacterium]|nr:AraC family transcriptional regulator [Hyphomicrobiales bacterium]